MNRKLAILLALTAFVLLPALPASATCVPGRVEVDPKSKKVIIELPRCNPIN